MRRQVAESGGRGAIEVAKLCGNAGSLSELLAAAADNIQAADAQYQGRGAGSEAATPGVFLLRIPNLPKSVEKGIDPPPSWERCGEDSGFCKESRYGVNRSD
ncbi:hypothetical protein GCM10009624_36030 [Gordonia sinesedis]